MAMIPTRRRANQRRYWSRKVVIRLLQKRHCSIILTGAGELSQIETVRPGK